MRSRRQSESPSKSESSSAADASSSSSDDRSTMTGLRAAAALGAARARGATSDSPADSSAEPSEACAGPRCAERHKRTCLRGSWPQAWSCRNTGHVHIEIGLCIIGASLPILDRGNVPKKVPPPPNCPPSSWLSWPPQALSPPGRSRRSPCGMATTVCAAPYPTCTPADEHESCSPVRVEQAAAFCHGNT